MKKFFAILLTVTILLSVFAGMEFFSVSAGTSGYYTYSVSGNKATITKVGTQISGDINIPDTLGGYSVTSIGDSAFNGCTKLTSITITDSVTSIGIYAFSGCTGLTSITIPNSVTSIGDSAFSGCTGLTSITIPDSVTSIGISAFRGCSSLEEITLPFVGDKRHKSTDSCQYPLGYIFGTMFYTGGIATTQQYYYGSSNFSTTSSNYYIPSSLKKVTVTDCNYLQYGAFYGCAGLTSVTIGNSVTSIGGYVFYGCTGLTSITIPDSVTSISNYAFYGCTGLTSITIPDSVTSIGSSAFRDCTGLTSIIIPDSVTSIDSSAFYGTGLESINVSKDNIVYHSSGNCLIETESKTLISGCNYSIIPSDNSVTSIGANAFYGCTGLTSITIPDSVTSIGSYAFYGCTGLTSITIPDSVTSIGRAAFAGCTGLTSITIPDSATSIGMAAFDGTAWYKNQPDGLVYVGNFAYKYKGTCPARVSIKEGTLGIANGAFYGCTGLTSITIPDSVTSIGDYAFSSCTGLTSITIPDSVTSIGEGAFSGCTGLTSIIIPNSVTSIGSSAFYRCIGIIEITIPDSVTLIGYGAIQDSTIILCYKNSYAENYAIMNSKKYALLIGENTKSYTMGEKLYIIGTGETDNWKTQGGAPWYDLAEQIKEIIIDEGITKIGTYAFYCLDNLESVICKNEDLEFGRYALNTTNENLTVYSKNGALTEYCGNNGIRFIDVTATPELVEVTANSLTVKAVSGYEYSKDMVNWQTSGVFIGLSPVTEYNIYARLIKTKDEFPGKISEPLTVTTDKASVSAPPKPVCIRNTDTEITLKANGLYEYSIDGENWQKSNVFTGLIHKNTYSLYQRVAETETEYASVPSAPLIMQLVKKTVSAPAAPDYQSHTDNSITLAPNELYEFSIDGENWQKSNVFAGLSKNMIYRFYQRVAETETEYASEPSAALIIALPGTPVACGTEDTITVKSIEGFEYCLDDFVWQDSLSFDMLLDNTDYMVYQRLKAINGEKVYQITSEPTVIITDNSTSVHRYNAVITEPTCTEKGFTTYTCEKCGKTFVDNYVTALGHDYKAAVTQPTCTARGYTTYTCSRCGDSYIDDYTAALNHPHTEIRGAFAATCTENGYTGDTYCLDCGEKIAAGENISALGHSFGDWIVITNPNCTEKGVEKRVCSRDHDHIETRDVNALGHNYRMVVTPPTCTEQGYTTHTCSRCGDCYIDNYTNALNHLHTEIRNAVIATCTENGYTGDTYCLDCGEKIAGGETISAFGHSFGDWIVITNPNCTEKGVERRVCSRDNSHTETRNINALGHKYNAVITLPTCTEQGYTTYTCSRCGDCYIDNYTNALNHLHTEIRNAVIATCTENGYTGDTYCLDCGEKIAAGESISALGHKYSAATTPPTCTEQGYTTYTCENCGDSYIDGYVNATGHTAGEWVTDTEKHWHICSDCGERLDEANHTESDWITDKEALPGIAGERHKECTVCGYITETEIIPALAAYKPGDINNDGEVDNKDLTRLFQYLSNWDVTVNEPALDVNGDGSVDNKDLTRLFQYLSNWDVEIF